MDEDDSEFGLGEEEILYNRKAIENSKFCGCYCCVNFFHKDEIDEWLDEREAVCPYCLQASVVPVNNKSIVEELSLAKISKKIEKRLGLTDEDSSYK